MATVAIALGSNLGDRRGHLVWAVEQLGRTLRDIRVSPLVETEPVDVPGPQPPYLNAVLVGETDAGPDELLGVLMGLEQACGRERPAWRAPRTLDLDLILHGDVVIDTPTLSIPHPRFRERSFVLDPLADLVPEMRDPMTGRTLRELQRLGPR